MIGEMASEEPFGLARTICHGESARQTKRIEAMEIAAGREDRWRADQVAARHGRDIAAFQRRQDRRDLGVIGKLANDLVERIVALTTALPSLGQCNGVFPGEH